jgi:hypothetical protein
MLVLTSPERLIDTEVFMFGMTSAVLLKADPNQEPEPILLGGGDTDKVSEIQAKIGGHFDVVRRGAVDTSGKNASFEIVGYVHDEGKILNLPINPMATMLFEQNIHGDVVLVSATNPETRETDGEDYDLPSEFTQYLILGMYEEMRESLAFSKFVSSAIARAVRDNAVSADDANEFLQFLAKMDEKGVAMGTVGDLPEKFMGIIKKSIAHAMDIVTKEDDSE